MLQLQIMSDLHIETYTAEGDQSIPRALDYIIPKAKVLILAGDIGRVHKFSQLSSFLKDLCQHFEYVLYVPGNHEYYKVRDVEVKNMEELLNDLHSLKADIPNLHILDRNSVIIKDVCIIGCTLWSKADIEIPRFMLRIKGMNNEKYDYLFERDLAYIKYMINYCKEKELKLVIATHYCPTFSVTKRFSDRYQSLYMTDLDYLLKKENVHTWICGHIHSNFDFVFDYGGLEQKLGTRIVSNQKGKPHDNVITFVKDKVITVD